MARALWVSDFEWRRDHLLVRETGVRVPLNGGVVREFLAWFVFYLALQPLRAGRRLFRRPLKLAFCPAPPRPWFLLWAVAQAAGVRFVPHAQAGDADAVLYFEDQTHARPALPPGVGDGGQRLINFDCGDVSKSRVARVFEEVFGYALAVDPQTWSGQAVEKSEINGAHDGRIVTCPTAARPGCVYQRVVDNARDDGLVEDIRCPTVLGDIRVAFLKRRPVSDRFANANCQVELVEVGDVLSDEERDTLARFAQAMGLGWGGLDVLRDRHDGRIYVVDVNKTDMGPPTALGLSDKLKATRRLARALRAAIIRDGE